MVVRVCRTCFSESSLCLLEAVLEVVTSMKWETRYVNNIIKNEENYIDLKRIEE